MTSEKYVERGVESASESTVYASDTEAEERKRTSEGAVGYPDSDHDEVEEMDRGHMEDVARERVSSLVELYWGWFLLTSSDQRKYPSNTQREIEQS